MSNVRSKNAGVDPIAIVCADIHLSAKPPLARSDEPSWFMAMARPLHEVSQLAKRYGVPVLCAGDLFDKWNVPPELISFAVRHLPEQFYTIAGQHDLPFHGLADIHRSGLGVLQAVERVEVVGNIPITVFPRVHVYGFSWNQPIREPEESGNLRVALVHAYCWMKGMSYAGSPDESHVKSFAEKLQAYDVAIFGDNHSPFERKIGNTLIYNCGGFMRRKSDDNFRPSVGLLFPDGTIRRHYLNTDDDVFTPKSDYLTAELADANVVDFVTSLKTESSDSLDFFTMLRQALTGQPEGVRQVLQEVMDAHRQ